MNKFFFAFFLAFVAVATADYSVQCYECTTIVGAIENLGLSNSSIAEIQKKLDYICESVPGFATTCEAVVAYGLPYVIQIVQSETPEKACELLGLCTSSTSAVARPAVLANGATCLGCTYVVSAVESYIATSADPATIEKQLDQLCAYVPNFETICDAMAAQEIKTIIQWIKNENSTVVCQKVGLCTATFAPLRAQALPTFNELACEACQVVVGFAHQYFLNGNTFKQVEEKVDALFCNQLPSAFSATCVALVDQGYQSVLKIANTETPQFVCANQLHVCQTSTQPAAKPFLVAHKA